MAETQAVMREAHALTIFRGLATGDGRSYSAVTFPADPYQGCERFIRQARAVGWVGDTYLGAYAVLDVLNEDGDIVQDFPITTSRAFQAIKKKLGLVVDAFDTEPIGDSEISFSVVPGEDGDHHG